MSRSFLKVLAPAAALIGALSIVSPASAADTSFATYTGLNGTFVTTTTASLVTMKETGSVVFSFLNTSLAADFTGINATVTFMATAPAADYSGGTIKDLSDVAGAYTFTSTAAYTVNGIYHAAGSDLLTVAFTGGDLLGKNGGHVASLTADNTTGSTVTYSSDFLSFINSNSSDFSIALSAVNPKFGGTTTLSPFVGTPVGVFSADPVPVVVGSVPEPATWALMLVGFGAIGMGIRTSARRNLRTA